MIKRLKTNKVLVMPSADAKLVSENINVVDEQVGVLNNGLKPGLAESFVLPMKVLYKLKGLIEDENCMKATIGDEFSEAEQTKAMCVTDFETFEKIFGVMRSILTTLKVNLDGGNLTSDDVQGFQAHAIWLRDSSRAAWENKA